MENQGFPTVSLRERARDMQGTPTVQRHISGALAELRSSGPVLYLIEGVGTGLYKIGTTRNLPTRYSQLAYGSPVPLRPVNAVSMRGNDPHWVERRVHEFYDEFRSHGEWFALPSECLLKTPVAATEFIEVARAMRRLEPR